jgi:hypothetical protein
MTTNFPTVMNPTDLSTALAQSQVQETTGLAGVSFLKIDFESGEWLLGQDNDIVSNEEILVNTTTIEHGWILWSGNRPQKTFARFQHPLPQQMEPIGDDFPSEARSFHFPKVKLTSESYANKKRGGKLTYNPVFEIVAWCDIDGNEEREAPAQVEAQPDPEAEAPAEPKKRQRRKTKSAA